MSNVVIILCAVVAICEGNIASCSLVVRSDMASCGIDVSRLVVDCRRQPFGRQVGHAGCAGHAGSDFGDRKLWVDNCVVPEIEESRSGGIRMFWSASGI